MKIFYFLLLISLHELLFANPCLTIDGAKTPKNKDITIYFENDIFGGTDENYSNGMGVSFYCDIDKKSCKKIFPDRDRRQGFIFENLMYTDDVKYLADESEHKHPYGGITYAGYVFSARNKNTLDVFEVDLGLVGPDSYTEDIQNYFHNHVFGNDLREGWAEQLDTEVGLILSYERKYKWKVNDNLELLAHVGGAAGNIFTHLDGGIGARAGCNMPDDFLPLGLERPPHEPMGKAKSKYGFYVFVNTDARAVLRDIFLDGNTFRDSRSVDKENFVCELKAGAGIRVCKLTIEYTHTLRTKEFKEADHNIDQFGSINICYPF